MQWHLPVQARGSGPHNAAVPREVVVAAVAVAFAVGVVVLLVVRAQVVQREAVVRNHKIDAVVWLPATPKAHLGAGRP